MRISTRPTSGADRLQRGVVPSVLFQRMLANKQQRCARIVVIDPAGPTPLAMPSCSWA